jgi:F0F1-type ATP synthase membrane subunit b/b'
LHEKEETIKKRDSEIQRLLEQFEQNQKDWELKIEELKKEMEERSKQTN